MHPANQLPSRAAEEREWFSLDHPCVPIMIGTDTSLSSIPRMYDARGGFTPTASPGSIRESS
jgi:hypothetical protein